MTKRDKAEFETAEPLRDYPEPEPAGYRNPVSADTASPEKSETRHFNDWLDRALPMLQQQLANLGIISVTAPPGKTKH